MIRKKSLGQHFLHTPALQQQISEWVLKVTEPRNILYEIGPGEGALTHHFRGQFKKCVLFELDDELAKYWKSQTEEWRKSGTELEVIHGDFLKTDLSSWTPQLIVGNLPFNISIPIYLKCLELTWKHPLHLIFMFQKEVADRLMACGGKDFGSLSLWAQCHGPIQKLKDISPHHFSPPPKVKSTIIYQRAQSPKGWNLENRPQIEEFLKFCFSQRRKQLFKRLKARYERAKTWWEEKGLDTRLRPEDLKLEQWQELLSNVFKN